MDSEMVVDTLMEVDPGFVDLCKTLLGDAVDPQEAWEFLYGHEPVVKMSPDPSSVSTKAGISGRARKVMRAKGVKGGLLVAAGAAAGVPIGATKRTDDDTEVSVARSMTRNTPVSYGKADEEPEDGTFSVTWSGEFSKADDERRQVFGWASVVEVDGQPVIDRQGDWITPDEIEKAAYEYVIKSRVGGHQHKRTEAGAFKASDMIESIVFTPEKIEKMGLPEDFPLGWWVGYKVHDEETWSKVKKGDITGFSIHGRGKRAQVAEVDA